MSLGRFTSVHQPVKRLKCPFQVGVSIPASCDEDKCPFKLWCGKFAKCRLRCIGESCRDCGNGVLYTTSAEKVAT